jgi:uncharacterized membrane-anchored protein YhcB (DUF1043 family)
MSATVLVGIGVLLVFAGVGLGYWLGTIGRNQEARKVSDLKSELDDYRQNVTDHFNVTAEKFQTIGNEYRKLYEHMASGAVALCHPDQSGEQLEFPSGELVGRDKADIEANAEMASDSPPVDFEVSEPEVAAKADAGMLDAELPEVEPTDEDLLETESTEELLAEQDPPREVTVEGKTYH